MAQALPVGRLVRVSINLQPLAAARRGFGTLLVIGNSSVIDGSERIRSYTTLDAVATDFGLASEEYKAAALYFGQTPRPDKLMIGRWLEDDASGFVKGGILSAAQQAINGFNLITAGSMLVTVDGVLETLTGLNFSAAPNLNAVATVVNAALAGSAICVWDGERFKITSTSAGAGTKATGNITLTGNPAAADTVTVNGTVVTFVAANPVGNQVLIGATSAITAANLQAFLAASANANIAAASYSTVGLVTTITHDNVGAAGNAFTLTEVSTSITVSGATLTGGTEISSVSYGSNHSVGQPIAEMFKLTNGLANAPVPGADAEEPVDAVLALANISGAWYGSMFSAEITDNQHLAVAELIEGLSLSRIYGVTITNTSVLDAVVTNDLGSQLKALNRRRTTATYSPNPVAIAAAFGRAFSVNFNANRSTITLMYKQMPGIVAELLSETQAMTLKDKRVNVYAEYENDTAIYQYGTMCGDAYFDEIHGLDWFKDALQNAEYNLLYQSKTKIPQTDPGMNQIITTAAGVCNEAVNNGFVAPGQWNADGFGQLERGDTLPKGYYIYAPPMALQNQAIRETRVAPPMQIALKLAGAIHEIDAIVDVNR